MDGHDTIADYSKLHEAADWESQIDFAEDVARVNEPYKERHRCRELTTLMSRYPRSIRTSRAKSVQCNAPATETVDESTSLSSAATPSSTPGLTRFRIVLQR
ncbi:hypothetical protein B4589_009225 [Halolamina sp. CBA1230]|uniref:hypothetical protein n=1 Tax=Halolamina sp. CBA1230 TaxID=1853690 RepID=UPI00159325AD|nr:hypothetical protein [Halolamina sp. CBA1230]QKY20549.1 hypothetical protein B4589_009225 [Halolamina sp. CBA1230]